MKYSVNLKEACYSTGTGDYIIALFRIEDSSLNDPILISTDATQRFDDLSTDREIVYGTMHNGEKYLYFPMEWGLPDDSENKIPTLDITVANVGGEMTKTLREMMYSPTVTLTLVLSSNPDSIEGRISNLQMASVSTNQVSITGALTLDLMLDEAFPMHTFTPSTAKGCFQA